MNRGSYIFTQLCQFLPRDYFEYLVGRYQGNKYIKSFTSWNHLLVLLFGQLTNRESLRDLILTLNTHKEKFHHLGFGKSVTRSNLSKANEIRSVEIFEQFSQRMIDIAREKRSVIPDFFIENDLYAFDSSIITLCVKTFWWSSSRKGKGGVKLHTLYDVKRQIPQINIITDQAVSDSLMMGSIPYQSDSFYVFDKAYVSTPQLYIINCIGAFFVVRKKKNMVYRVVETRSCDEKRTGVIADQLVQLTGKISQKGYPEIIRCVTYYSKEKKETYVFFTNNMGMPPQDIALIYKHRWDIEVFFKWMKQHLRIKEFYGTSFNAVKIQIYAAIIAYCLIAILERELGTKMSTYEVLRILSVGLLEKRNIRDLFAGKQTQNYHFDTQLTLNLF